jgi:hypothetical protein
MTMAVSLPNAAALRVVEAFPSVRPRAADNRLPLWPTAYQATLLVRCPVGHRTDRGLTGDNTRSGRDNRISPPYIPGRPATCGSIIPVEEGTLPPGASATTRAAGTTWRRDLHAYEGGGLYSRATTMKASGRGDPHWIRARRHTAARDGYHRTRRPEHSRIRTDAT